MVTADGVGGQQWPANPSAVLLAIEWLDTAIVAMNETVQHQQTQLPGTIDVLQKERTARHERRRRLLELVETGSIQLGADRTEARGDGSQSSIIGRLNELDQEILDISDKIVKAEMQLDVAIKLPSPEFIAAQVKNLPTALCADEQGAAILLGQLFDEVGVHRIGPPRKRSYHELRFSLKAWRIVYAALGGKVPQIVLDSINDHGSGGDDESPVFCLVVDGHVGRTNRDSASK